MVHQRVTYLLSGLGVIKSGPNSAIYRRQQRERSAVFRVSGAGAALLQSPLRDLRCCHRVDGRYILVRNFREEFKIQTWRRRVREFARLP